MRNKRSRTFFALSSIIISITFVCGLVSLKSDKEAWAAGGQGYTDVYFKTTDSVTLHGWLIRTSAPKKGTIIHLRCYPEYSGTKADDLLWLKGAGYDIFAFDYRGSGSSGGSPTLGGMLIDTAAAIETAFGLVDVKGLPVFILGQGPGGALSVYALANSPYKGSISGLIIDGSFAGLKDLRDERLKTLGLTRPFKEVLTAIADDSYSPVRWISKISPVPVIIIHGDGDEAVPLRSGLELYDRAGRPKVLMIADGKVDAEALSDTEIRKRLISYLAKVN